MSQWLVDTMEVNGGQTFFKILQKNVTGLYSGLNPTEIQYICMSSYPAASQDLWVN